MDHDYIDTSLRDEQRQYAHRRHLREVHPYVEQEKMTYSLRFGDRMMKSRLVNFNKACEIVDEAWSTGQYNEAAVVDVNGRVCYRRYRG